MLFAEGPVSFD